MRSATCSRASAQLTPTFRPCPGVRGRLIDLCRPVSKRYETAVTRVLGKQAEAIVVDTADVAFECMSVRVGGGACTGPTPRTHEI